MNHQNLFINGDWIAGEGASFQSVDPAKNQLIWEAKAASANQVDAAVNAARNAQFAWSGLALDERINICRKFAELLKENVEELGFAIAQETGKPLWESKTEVTAMFGKIEISVKAYNDRTGITENPMPVGQAFIRHKPHGVVAIFGPYNFPGHLPNGHIVPAIIAGNTVVFKPSELTPNVAEKTLKLWELAGLPKGVINLVQGEVETGKALASHSGIDGLFFTGSSTTGKLLHQQFSGHPGKILALEMGGNNPLIVKNVANIDAAIHDIVQSAFISAGQRCTCARRLFIEAGDQGDLLIEKLLNVTHQLTVDDYDAETQPFMGAMISAKAASKMVTAQQKLIDAGAKPLLKLTQKDPEKGFVTPGIIDVTGIDLADQEDFGPLLKIYRYNSFDEAIDEANNTSFGLSAGLLADSKDDYEYFYRRIRAGIVNWNRPITGASSAAPFGGIGDSGNHRASAYYAADYCSYPVASVELDEVTLPVSLSPGLTI